jgi:hypothetical protein
MVRDDGQMTERARLTVSGRRAGGRARVIEAARGVLLAVPRAGAGLERSLGRMSPRRDRRAGRPRGSGLGQGPLKLGGEIARAARALSRP